MWLAHEVEVLAQLYLSTLAIVDPVPVLDDEAIAIVLENLKLTDYVLKSDVRRQAMANRMILNETAWFGGERWTH
ncbi:L-fuculose phosphate aldolase [Salmonella enterica subsp. enterica]|uniref:L-fuculose phosphate aldolase n=1 Tax=Salmonella enterica I TaxID=59201 RepID=A0A379WNA9_SALET|nr:L-fuculose phosphate aldolase [Salmonella enterica subsp. enterica]